jgi:nitroimidazol reductase NimA-like FMN-containing flavoprotein (pyridoxamine 5'-phosphate oxidase superfamily)
MEDQNPATERVRVRRLPERGRYDRESVEGILDEARICHLGFVVEGQPFVIPTIHARVGDRVYVHGSAASRALRVLREGVPVCLTVTILDGLVVARSVFEHSMNYRSVVVLGSALAVEDPDEKLIGLRAIVEHVLPGRWSEARLPNPAELKQTQLLALSLDEASAKVRTGPPKDQEEDYPLPIWAGEVPIELTWLPPRPDPSLRVGVEVPPSVLGLGLGPASDQATRA